MCLSSAAAVGKTLPSHTSLMAFIHQQTITYKAAWVHSSSRDHYFHYVFPRETQNFNTVSCSHSQSTVQLRAKEATDSRVMPLTKWQCYHTVLHSIPDVDCQVAYPYSTLLKHKCSGFLCCVCHLISPSSWLFLWISICELVQVLFWVL
jgi:hypothetical protein